MSRGRVVLGLEAGTPPRELAAAAALAGQVGAELVGLFMEDLDLLRFAALPFASEIGFASAARRKPDVGAMERSLRALAERARRRLEAAAAESAIQCSFQIRRGMSADALLAAATEALAGAAEIRLLLLGDGESPAARWAEQARSRMAPARRVQVVHAAGLVELAQALGEALPGIVVLRGDQARQAAADLHALLRASSAPVLIVPARRE